MRPGADRPLLALDSSTVFGTAAVGVAGGLIAEIGMSLRGGHSAALLPAIDQALRSTGLAPGDLAGVVVGGGPGSFTGVRISAAMAKGLVTALQVPLYAYSSLFTAAAQAWAAPGPVCALFDARGRDVYAAVYRFVPTLEVVHPPTASTLDEVVERHEGVTAPLFVGDGALRHREELQARLGATVASPYFGVPRAAALVWLAFTVPDIGLVSDPSAWEPDYLRPSGAERIAAARRGGSSSP